MTAQDNDLVQSVAVAVAVAADEPATIAPASRRDPIEDADASFTRKRPRLHGSNTLCAMSTEAHTPDNHVEMTIRSHPPSSPVRPGDDYHCHTGDVAASPSPAPVHSPILIPSSDDEATNPPVMVVNDEDEDDKDEPASPPVMVVDEDEDEDDEAVGLAVHIDPEDHFRRFPYSHVGSYTSVVRDLAQHVQDSASSLPCLRLVGAR